MRLPINLATRPFVNTRPFLVTTTVLGTLALALTAWVTVVGVGTWQQDAMTHAQTSELKSKKAELVAEHRQLIATLSTPNARRVLDRKLFLDRLIQRRRLSWIELFFDLQQHLPRQTRILSLSPALLANGNISLDLRVVGSSPSSVIEFVEALEKGEKFRNVMLLSQNEVSGRTAGTGATITAVYMQGQK
jgi:type IV pilus assembly protein PilN